jgi:hypothetical protein
MLAGDLLPQIGNPHSQAAATNRAILIEVRGSRHVWFSYHTEPMFLPHADEACHRKKSDWQLQGNSPGSAAECGPRLGWFGML